MCERTFVACGGCDLPATDLAFIEIQQEELSYSVDAEGEVQYDCEPGYGETDRVETYFRCDSCGWTGTSLDMECVPEDCDCEECVPEDYVEADSPVALVRFSDTRRDVVDVKDGWPPELKLLFSDRAVSFVPCTNERAEELCDAFNAITGMHPSIALAIRFDIPDPDFKPDYERISA